MSKNVAKGATFLTHAVEKKIEVKYKDSECLAGVSSKCLHRSA